MDRQKWSTYIRENWQLVTCGVLTLMSALLLVFARIVTTGDGHTSHFWLNLYRLLYLNVCMVFTIILWAFGVYTFICQKRNIQKITVIWFVFTGTNLFALGALPRLFIFHTIESITIESSVYHLTFTPGGLDQPDPGYYTLDECDPQGFACRVVYESEDIYYEGFDTVILTHDETSKTINILINGEFVYTYFLQ